MNRRNYAYQIPNASELALEGGLFARLKDLWSEARENSYEIYLYAAGLRNLYLDKKTNRYSPEFQKWYAKQELETLFGKLSSFTKYAAAGDVVNFFGQKYKNGKYITRLPLSRNGLYEIALLMNETNGVKLETLFHSGGDENDPLIHPSATASDISTYRNRDNVKVSPTSKARKGLLTIPLATIYVSKDLYKFDKTTGDHMGAVDLSDTEKALKRLRANLDRKLFDVRDNLEKITSAYEKRKDNSSPSAALRAKEKAKTRSR